MEIKLASLDDVEQIVELIKKRMEWMDKKNLYQWNKTGYLERYPNSYFEKRIEEGIFFIGVVEEKIVSAMALFKEDPRWENDVKALYVHHLVVDEKFKGLGKDMLSFAEEYGKEKNVHFIRLDSQKTNEKLNKYYDSMGYIKVGECVDGVYVGNTREKSLK